MDKNKQMAQFIEKARTMERMGNDEEALIMYKKVYKDYYPVKADFYESLCIILEKHKLYDDAIVICKKAIERINDKTVSGSTDKFEKRIQYLCKKNGSSNNYKEGRKKSKVKTTALLIVLGTVVVVGLIMLITIPKTSIFDNIHLLITKIGQDGFASEKEVTNKETTDESEVPKHKITDSMIDSARSLLEDEPDVEYANVSVQGDTLGFAIFVTPGTSKERCEELGEIFVKALGNAAASEIPGLKGTLDVTYGELYEHYNIIIAVGVSSEDITAKGTKDKGSSRIVWR